MRPAAAPAHPPRNAWAEVDLDALAHNVAHLTAAHTQRCMMTVLKANAYGHGLLPVARFLHGLGQRLFGVALVEEAVALREAGITGRILVLGPPAPGTHALYAAHDVEMTVPALHHLREAAAALPVRAGVALHVKLDTGMGRIGFNERDPDALAAALDEALAAAGDRVRLRALYSHLAEAEALDSDHAERQRATFEAVRAAWARRRPHEPPPECHLANSAGLLRDPAFHYDYARVGYALWAPVDFEPRQLPASAALRQPLTVRARVSYVKRTRAGDTVGYGRTYRCAEGEGIATLPLGYGDGIFRGLSNRGEVLLGGRRRPIVGRVSMDQITVSVGADVAAVGDEAVLLGSNGREGALPVAEMAGWLDTIGYEVFTHLAPRLPRVYLRGGRPVPEP